MVNNENIDAFINYNYIPFNKAQSIKRIVFMWVSSTILCLIGKQLLIWMLPFALINILISILFITLITKSNDSKLSRYLSDGIFYLYIAVVLNLASYRVMTLQIGSNGILAIILMLLMLACILIFVFVTLSNIKSNKFSGIGNAKKIISLPFLGGICGILAAKFFMQGQSQQTVLIIVAFIFLILSFIMSIPSINLLKAILYKWQDKH